MPCFREIEGRRRRRRRNEASSVLWIVLATIAHSLTLIPVSSLGVGYKHRHCSRRVTSKGKGHTFTKATTDDQYLQSDVYARSFIDSPQSVDRRKTLTSLAATASALFLKPSMARSAETNSLEQVLLGQGEWVPLNRAALSSTSSGTVSPSFCTYAARFLINFDPAIQRWWRNAEKTCSHLNKEERLSTMGRSFGSLAKSFELAVDYTLEHASTPKAAFESLFDQFTKRYERQSAEAQRQISLLFCILPNDQQPTSRLISACGFRRSLTPAERASSYEEITTDSEFAKDFSALLPAAYECVQARDSGLYSIQPTVSFFEIGIDEEFGQTAVATAFGPFAEVPLIREKPIYSPTIYALLGLSGAMGCCLTHSVAIPIDVVKTRCQVEPDEYRGFVRGGLRVFDEEGLTGLLLGAEATLVGYTWYGMSVYPCYTFFKRLLSLSVLPQEFVASNANAIALVAGALASVVASFGLTPLEAARIRVVSKPETYRQLGLSGTLVAIAAEDPVAGWKAAYAGLSSLLTRQVIFGSVKFLAFERASEQMFSAWPHLRDQTWTCLLVSVAAGFFSGSLSSIVSQPADSVLTYVANTGGASNRSLLQAGLAMINKDGPGSLFRGLGSRCIWAATIIAGQFLLYDIFRTYFGVSSDDLSQVYQLTLE
jgi:solute carrier family 25 phosphate transporter 3